MFHQTLSWKDRLLSASNKYTLLSYIDLLPCLFSTCLHHRVSSILLLVEKALYRDHTFSYSAIRLQIKPGLLPARQITLVLVPGHKIYCKDRSPASHHLLSNPAGRWQTLQLL